MKKQKIFTGILKTLLNSCSFILILMLMIGFFTNTSHFNNILVMYFLIPGLLLWTFICNQYLKKLS